MFGSVLDRLGFAIIGGFVGSFLGLLLERYPAWLRTPIEQPSIKGLSIFAYPPSHCFHCFHRLNWYENIPVISYLWLRGACAFCRLPIPKYIWFVELLTTAITILLAFDPRISSLRQLWTIGLVSWILIALGGFDYRYRLLPDFLTQGLLWGCLLLQSYSAFSGHLRQSVHGAIFGFALLWILQQIYWCLNKEAGMGDGDLKFAAALGSCLGSRALIQVLSSSCILALLVFVFEWIVGHPPQREIPFGFFLAIAAGIQIFCHGIMGQTLLIGAFSSLI